MQCCASAVKIILCLYSLFTALALYSCIVYFIEILQQLNVNIFTLLKIPECSVLYISMVSCGMSLSYLGPIFSPYMKATVSLYNTTAVYSLFSYAMLCYAMLIIGNQFLKVII